MNNIEELNNDEVDKLKRCGAGKHEFRPYQRIVGQRADTVQYFYCVKCLMFVTKRQVEKKNQDYNKKLSEQK